MPDDPYTLTVDVFGEAPSSDTNWDLGAFGIPGFSAFDYEGSTQDLLEQQRIANETAPPSEDSAGEPVDIGYTLPVDVYTGTPEPTPMDLPAFYSPPGLFQPSPVEGAGPTAEGGNVNDFGDSSGIFYPSDPTDWLDLASTAMGFLGTPGITASPAPITAVQRERQRTKCHTPRGWRAPNSSFFGGICPPGTVEKHQRGRNICMRKPHMNVLNSCALSRATRRVTGFLNRVKSTQKHLVTALSHAGVHGTRRPMSRKGGCGGCGARTRKTCIC